MLALKPPIGGDDLDWLNLNRPLVSDRGHNVVLWCEDDAAAVLARGAPDFFDWISARVDCPPAPAAHAVADVKSAIRARACGIAWAGPGLEDTLAAVRPGRPVRRVAVAGYRSMLDALTSREPGWLLLDGIDTEFHLRRLRWAMAETGRRVLVLRQVGLDFDRSTPGWWTVNATQVPIAEAVRDLTAAGGTGRLAALTGLAPDACMYAGFALRRAIATERLEALLAATADPRGALHDLARHSGWTATRVIREHDPGRTLVATRRAVESGTARHERDDDPIVSALRRQPLEPERWAEIGTEALQAGDFDVAIRWLTAALRSLPKDVSVQYTATVLTRRGRAHRLAGDLPAAHRVLGDAYDIARSARDATLIAMSAAELGYTLLDLGEPRLARECLESALSASKKRGDPKDVANLLDTLARALAALGDLAGARKQLDRALRIKRQVFLTEEHPAVAVTLGLRGIVLAAQRHLTRARRDLERSLEILEISKERSGAEHPSAGVILSALANVERDTGDLRSARTRLDRALAIQRALLGADHPDVADTLVALAGVLADSGNLDDAIAALKDALVIQQAVFRNDGQIAGARTRQELARVLVARGDLTGALDNLRQALATRRRIHERDDHPHVASILSELDRLQRLQRNLQNTD